MKVASLAARQRELGPAKVPGCRIDFQLPVIELSPDEDFHIAMLTPPQAHKVAAVLCRFSDDSTKFKVEKHVCMNIKQ